MRSFANYTSYVLISGFWEAMSPQENTILTGAAADYNMHGIVYAYTHFAFVRTSLFTVGNTNRHFCELSDR